MLAGEGDRALLNEVGRFTRFREFQIEKVPKTSGNRASRKAAPLEKAAPQTSTSRTALTPGRNASKLNQ